MAVLTRGYGAVEDESGKIVTGASMLKKDAQIKIRFSDGGANATVTEIRLNK